MKISGVVELVGLVCLVSVGFYSAWGQSGQDYLAGAEAKIQYRIVDDGGEPVPGALVRACFLSMSPLKELVEQKGKTDSAGIFVARQVTNDRLDVSVFKDGYYDSSDVLSFLDTKKYRPSEGKWLPYGELRQLVLRRIRSPSDMAVTARRYHRFPAFGRWTAFDLEKGDWTGLHGTGSHDDVLIRFSEHADAYGSVRVMEVSFTNNAFGGCYVGKLDCMSGMNTDYRVDENACFEPSLTFSVTKQGRGRIDKLLEADQYLVFRTRTVTNEEGRLLQAHYGTLHGKWGFMNRGGMVIPRITFNPVANDLSLEDAARAKMAKERWRRVAQ